MHGLAIILESQVTKHEDLNLIYLLYIITIPRNNGHYIRPANEIILNRFIILPRNLLPYILYTVKVIIWSII